jgi:hypothetical protein
VKKTERSLVLIKKFDRAEETKQKVRELEKVDSEVAQGRAVAEMEKQRQRVFTKHEIEIQTFEIHAESQLNQIKQSQEGKIQAILARQGRLENELEEWKRNPSTSLPLMTSGIPELQHQAVMTPRTTQKYSAFKKVIKGPVITIKPLGSMIPNRRKRVTNCMENKGR